MKKPTKELERTSEQLDIPPNDIFIDLDEEIDPQYMANMPLSTQRSLGLAMARETEKSVETVDELFDAVDEADFIPKDSKTEIFTESLEASVGYSSLIRQLTESVKTRMTFFMSESGGSLDFEEARRVAFKKCENAEEAKAQFRLLVQLPAEGTCFYDLAKLWDVAPRAAERVWEMIKAEGRKEFESGHFAANAMFPTAQLKNAWKIAEYLGIRESMLDESKPKSGIELSLIDMLVQAFFKWQYWVEQSVLRAETPPRLEHPEYRKWKSRIADPPEGKSWDEGDWFPQYVSEKEALEQATQMADKWHRIYIRTLRALRDHRRYSPVTINNAKQVNIATDGSNQANIAE
ncbi:MAG: hypothetical protein KF881_01630 [Acidobacteria bacterium]|nr:hypothetical protein [Acidobacteriota bacterium]